MSDAQTLRLAYPEITPAELRTYLSAILRDGTFDLKVLETSQMKLEQAHRIHVAVQAFCAPRRSAKTLEARLTEARLKVEAAMARNEPPNEKELELAETLPARLRELTSDARLREIFSAQTIATLRAHEAELLALPNAVG